MITIHALVPYLVRPECSTCGPIDAPYLEVIGQFIAPAANTHKVRVAIEFLCPRCQQPTRASSMVTSNQLHRALDRGLRMGECRYRYHPPVRVLTNRVITRIVKSRPGMGPITDEEVERLRRLLARTSFKVKSKGWKLFLARLTGGGERS